MGTTVEVYHKTLAELYDYFIPYPTEKLHKSNHDPVALMAALHVGDIEESGGLPQARGSFIGTASSAVVVIYNDAAYSAEIHYYGSQGLTAKPMLIPEVGFSGIARALGAEPAIIRSLADLGPLTDWSDAGASGIFVDDCRITSSVRAPWLKRMDAGLAGGEDGGGWLTRAHDPEPHFTFIAIPIQF